MKNTIKFGRRKPQEQTQVQEEVQAIRCNFVVLEDGTTIRID